MLASILEARKGWKISAGVDVVSVAGNEKLLLSSSLWNWKPKVTETCITLHHVPLRKSVPQDTQNLFHRKRGNCLLAVTNSQCNRCAGSEMCLWVTEFPFADLWSAFVSCLASLIKRQSVGAGAAFHFQVRWGFVQARNWKTLRLIIKDDSGQRVKQQGAMIYGKCDKYDVEMCQNMNVT